MVAMVPARIENPGISRRGGRRRRHSARAARVPVQAVNTVLRRSDRRMNSTRMDRSNIPTGGMMRRRGRSTGSVRSKASEFKNATMPERAGGNHENTTRTASTTRYTRSNVPMKSRTSGLEQAARLQPLLLLLRDFDVGGREHEHPVGNLGHLAPDRVGESAREIDEATLQLVGKALQVQDHWLARLEAITDFLRVVEALGLDHVDSCGRGGGVSIEPKSCVASRGSCAVRSRLGSRPPPSRSSWASRNPSRPPRPSRGSRDESTGSPYSP